MWYNTCQATVGHLNKKELQKMLNEGILKGFLITNALM